MSGEGSFQMVGVCDAKCNSLADDIKDLKDDAILIEADRKRDMDKIYKKLDRLPNWAVFIMTAGGGLIGYLIDSL